MSILSRTIFKAIARNQVASQISPFSRSAAASSDPVLSEERNNAGVITLNRPKVLNTFNLNMLRDIHKYIVQFEAAKDLVIIKGAGEKSFCAGGDVRALLESNPFALAKTLFKEEFTLIYMINQLKKPYVAIMDGFTMGGGVGLSVYGHFRIATERTIFAMPEVAIGLFPDVGASYFLSRLDGKIGLYLGLTGHRLKGVDVQKCGLATHYCESSNLSNLEESLSNCKSHSDIESTLAKFCPKDGSFDFELTPHLVEINKCFSGATVEDIVENLKKSNTDFSQGTLKLLAKMSPTSLKVTKQQIELGSKQSLAQCLIMEYRMAFHYLDDSDFREGVRALLIDKDQQPKWNPKTLEDVSQARVDFYFSPVPGGDLHFQ